MRQRRRTRARGIQGDGFAMESTLASAARSAADLLEESAIRFLLDGLEVESIRELKRLVDGGRVLDHMIEVGGEDVRLELEMEPVIPAAESIADLVDAARADRYRSGFADGIAAYAWWDSGTQMVGTTGRTLAQALERVEETWNYLP